VQNRIWAAHHHNALSAAAALSTAKDMGLHDGFDAKAVSGAVMLDSPWVSQKFTSHDDAFGRRSTSAKTNTSAKLYDIVSPHSNHS
jgi:hypothetical protein